MSGVWCLGFGVLGVGFWGFECEVWGVGCVFGGVKCDGWCSVFAVWGVGFGILCWGCGDDLRSIVHVLWFRGSGPRFRVQGLGCRVHDS